MSELRLYADRCHGMEKMSKNLKLDKEETPRTKGVLTGLDVVEIRSYLQKLRLQKVVGIKEAINVKGSVEEYVGDLVVPVEEITSEEKEVHNNNNQVAINDHFLQELKEQNAALEKKNAALEEQNVALEEQNAALRKQKTEPDGKNTLLREQNTELLEQNTALEEQNASLKLHIDKLTIQSHNFSVEQIKKMRMFYYGDSEMTVDERNECVKLKEEVSFLKQKLLKQENMYWSVKDELEGERKKMENLNYNSQMQLQQAKQFAGNLLGGVGGLQGVDSLLKGFNGSGRQYSMSNQYPSYGGFNY